MTDFECASLREIPEYPELYTVEDIRKLQYAKHLKALGVEEFKKDKIVEAFEKFGDALKLLVLLDGKSGVTVPENIEKTKSELKLTLYNNLAGCQVRRGNWEYAIDLCNSVLEKDPKNVKALYRRGWARLECEDYEIARNDLEQALELDPKNLAVKQKLALLTSLEKDLNQKYATAMKKMFL